jgi:hypothetical protein
VLIVGGGGFFLKLSNIRLFLADTVFGLVVVVNGAD